MQAPSARRTSAAAAQRHIGWCPRSSESEWPATPTVGLAGSQSRAGIRDGPSRREGRGRGDQPERLVVSRFEKGRDGPAASLPTGHCADCRHGDSSPFRRTPDEASLPWTRPPRQRLGGHRGHRQRFALAAFAGGFISIGKLADSFGMHVLDLRRWLRAGGYARPGQISSSVPADTWSQSIGRPRPGRRGPGTKPSASMRSTSVVPGVEVALGAGLDGQLEQQRVAGGELHVQVGDLVQGAAVGVRLPAHAERLAQRRRLAHASSQPYGPYAEATHSAMDRPAAHAAVRELLPIGREDRRHACLNFTG